MMVQKMYFNSNMAIFLDIYLKFQGGIYEIRIILFDEMFSSDLNLWNENNIECLKFHVVLPQKEQIPSGKLT